MPPDRCVHAVRSAGEDRLINPNRPELRFGSTRAVAIELRLLELLPEPAQQPHDLVILAGDLGLLELGHLERHTDGVGAAR